MKNSRYLILAGMVLAAAAVRLLPHPWNFTPIAAMALFGGAQCASKRAAFLMPLTALFLGDLVLGLHRLMPFVYGCFALTVCFGFWVRRRRSVQRIAFAAVASAILFFVLTNFGVWAIDNLYPKTTAGLVDCYVAAIPFFRNMLLGDLLYSALLFGALAFAENRFVRLREPAVGAA
jgi:hypothetical protein